MGKQPRRRNRRNNKSSQKGKQSSNNLENSSTTTAQNSEPQSLVTARIRHGDCRVRAGALSALSCTLFSPDALSSRKNSVAKQNLRKNKSNDINVHLLKAISEKVLDDDGAVAKNAAGCWNNFILFGGSDEDVKIMKEIDIGSILTTRIQTCCSKMMGTMDTVESLLIPTSDTNETAASPNASSTDDTAMSKKGSSKKNGNKKKKNEPNPKQHLSTIASQFDIANICLQTLCALIESVPEAVDKFTSKLVHTSPSAIGLPSSLAGSLPVTHILIEILLLGTRALTSPSLSTPLQSFGPTLELVGDCMTWSSRALHAILDENLPLAKWFLSNTATESKPECNSIMILSNIVQGGVFSSKTRLHCCGTLITLRNMVSSENDVSQNATPPFLLELTKMCIDIVLPLLLQYLEYHPNIATALAQRVARTIEALEEEKEDEQIEKKIIKQVNEKKESAREIAKRQKEEKKAKKIAAEKEEDMEIDKKEDINKTSKNGKDEDGSTKRKENAQEEYEKAAKAWENAASPLKLALEVATNFCSGSNGNTAQLSEEDDMMMYDSDMDEGALMEQENLGNESKTITLNPFDTPILEAIVKSHLPERVVALLSSITAPMQIMNNNQSVVTPKVVQNDIAQIISKCGSCLGNIGSTLPLKDADLRAAIVKIWESLRNGISTSSTTLQTKDNALLAIADLTNAMSSLLRSHSEIAASDNFNVVTEAKFLIQLLQHYMNENITEISNSSKQLDVEVVVLKEDILQNCTFLLGKCCTQLNENGKRNTAALSISGEVSKAFISILNTANTAVSVQNEILNVLMDIYGEDEISEINDLFDSLDMMKVFQKSIPLFKSNINKSKDMKRLSEKELLMWKETALNGRRFIDYKKGQMEL